MAWSGTLPRAPPRVMRCQRLPRGHAGAVLVIQEFDVAAERHPGEAPARAVAVVEAEDLLAEADREGLDRARRTSAPPGNGRARGRTPRSISTNRNGSSDGQEHVARSSISSCACSNSIWPSASGSRSPTAHAAALVNGAGRCTTILSSKFSANPRAAASTASTSSKSVRFRQQAARPLPCSSVSATSWAI